MTMIQSSRNVCSVVVLVELHNWLTRLTRHLAFVFSSSSSEVKMMILTRAWTLFFYVILSWYFARILVLLMLKGARVQFQLVPVEAAVFINDRLMFSVDYYLWSKLNLPEWAVLVLSSHIPIHCSLMMYPSQKQNNCSLKQLCDL